MTTTTTTETCEYDAKGNLLKRTTTTVTQEQDYRPTYIPGVPPDTTFPLGPFPYSVGTTGVSSAGEYTVRN